MGGWWVSESEIIIPANHFVRIVQLCSDLSSLPPCEQMPVDVHESPTASSSKGRSLRRTVSVPSEGPFPEYPAEGATMLGKHPGPTAESS